MDSASQMPDPGMPGCSSSRPIRAAHSITRSRAPSRCGLSVASNGSLNSGSWDGPTAWYGTWPCDRARRTAGPTPPGPPEPAGPAAGPPPPIAPLRRMSSAEVPTPPIANGSHQLPVPGSAPPVPAATPPPEPAAAPPPFMYRLERMCHSWPPDCQSWRPLTYASTRARPSGASPVSANSTGSSVNTVFSNCWSREVSRSLTASAASWVEHSRNFSSTRMPLLSSPSSSTSRW